MPAWRRRVGALLFVLGVYVAFIAVLSCLAAYMDAQTTSPLTVVDGLTLFGLGLAWMPATAHGVFELRWWKRRSMDGSRVGHGRRVG